MEYAVPEGNPVITMTSKKPLKYKAINAGIGVVFLVWARGDSGFRGHEQDEYKANLQLAAGTGTLGV